MKSRVYTDTCGRPYIFYGRLSIVLNYIVLVKNILGVFLFFFWLQIKGKYTMRYCLCYDYLMKLNVSNKSKTLNKQKKKKGGYKFIF